MHYLPLPVEAVAAEVALVVRELGVAQHPEFQPLRPEFPHDPLKPFEALGGHEQGAL